MIEICKILTGKYDIVIRYDLRKFFFFTKRVVNIRNSLPNNVVHAESTNIFKTNWMNFAAARKRFMEHSRNRKPKCN